MPNFPAPKSSTIAAASKTTRETIYRIAVPSPLRRLFDYLAPSAELNIPIGARVQIPFGRRQLVGIVIAQAKESEFDLAKLKRINSILDSEALLPKSIFQSLIWAADYYQHPIGDVFNSALPAKLRENKKAESSSLFWRLNSEINFSESEKILSRAPKQKELLNYIQDCETVKGTQLSVKSYSSALIKQLESKNLIESFEETDPPEPEFSIETILSEPELALNKDQSNALKSINDSSGKFECFLVDGVTGSGKTEVYMQAMNNCLKERKQCLVLVPEIGLTPQMINRFKRRFSVPVSVIHSGLTDSERLAAWKSARIGATAIIIGTRSSIFTPLLNPGLIVIDEEHDSSFKQQEGFRYSARDFALVRAKEENIPVLLGSATPSLESLANCKIGKFKQLILDSRAGSSMPALLSLVDSSEGTATQGFTDIALTSMAQHLSQNNQVLVYLNRRGFAPIVNCQSCGWIAECDSCNSHFTLHSKPAGLLCHHCNKTKRIPKACEQCKSRDLSTVGQGTQQIEKFLENAFSEVPVIRIDRDSTRRKNSLSDKLELVEKGEPCILIGTQMIAKGHHFPNITLVIIIDADAGLFSADFRGLEQMGQSIVQVAGRSGRAEKRGEVVIQSRHIAHESLQLLSSKPYSVFADLLLSQRMEVSLPPFSNMALFRIESPNYDHAMNFTRQLATRAEKAVKANKLAIQIIGPLPAPMEKRLGRYRMQLSLKSAKRPALNGLLKQLCREIDELKKPAKLRWSIDVDPLDVL